MLFLVDLSEPGGTRRTGLFVNSRVIRATIPSPTYSVPPVDWGVVYQSAIAMMPEDTSDDDDDDDYEPDWQDEDEDDDVVIRDIF